MFAIVFTVLNFLILSLVLHKVKLLEKDVEDFEKRINSMMKLLKGAYLRKSSKS